MVSYMIFTPIFMLGKDVQNLIGVGWGGGIRSNSGTVTLLKRQCKLPTEVLLLIAIAAVTFLTMTDATIYQ